MICLVKLEHGFLEWSDFWLLIRLSERSVFLSQTALRLKYIICRLCRNQQNLCPFINTLVIGVLQQTRKLTGLFVQSLKSVVISAQHLDKRHQTNVSSQKTWSKGHSLRDFSLRSK